MIRIPVAIVCAVVASWLTWKVLYWWQRARNAEDEARELRELQALNVAAEIFESGDSQVRPGRFNAGQQQ